jgi:hypothetical protein
MKKIFTLLLFLIFNTAFCQSFNEVLDCMFMDKTHFEVFMDKNGYNLMDTKKELRDGNEHWLKNSILNQKGIYIQAYGGNNYLNALTYNFNDSNLYYDFIKQYDILKRKQSSCGGIVGNVSIKNKCFQIKGEINNRPQKSSSNEFIGKYQIIILAY